MRRAIDQHYHYVNMMPTMEKAKKGLGLAPLASDSLLACFAKDSHQADAPAGPVACQRLRGGRGVGTRALRSFVVAVLTPSPSLPLSIL